MLRKFPLWLLVVSLPALATSKVVHFNEGLDLREVALNNATPDIRILPRELYAAKGIRLDEPGTYFRPTVSLKLGATYVVHGAINDEYLLTVEASGGSQLKLEVRPRLLEEKPVLRARFHVKSYVLGELALASALPDLRLYMDGSYRMGGATGRWSEQEGLISLDGYYAAWGMGEVNGTTLAFKFPRAGAWLTVTLERQAGEQSSPAPVTADAFATAKP